MMRFNLARMWRRAANPRRREVVLRKITAPATMASDLYAAAYAPVVEAWESALPEIESAYRRALSAQTTDSPADTATAISAAEADVTRLAITLRTRVQNWAVKVEKWQRDQWVGAVNTASSVDISTLIGAGDARDTVEAVIEANVGLIKSVSSQAQSRISDAVFRGMRERRNPDDVAKDIREATAMAKRRARNIAADQLVKITSSLGSERRRQAGISTWEWVHSSKLHPRHAHLERNGKRYDDADAPNDLPGQLPFCGCTERAVLSLDDDN